jgi:7-carboxy-7-deazaguanine synthase
MKTTVVERPLAQITAEISEIFSSTQGEGVYLGDKQIFVRFGRCNMHCVYCDELDKMQEGKYRDHTLTDVLNQVDCLETGEGPHQAVSLTGGEPLLYSEFLQAFLPELKAKGFQVHLETNGTLPKVLERHMQFVDVIAMDLKPPSSTQDHPFWDKHREFLSIAVRKEAFVKVIVTSGTTLEDVSRCIEIIRGVDDRIPFIFQPETLESGVSRQATEKIRHVFLKPAMEALRDVRLIPQMHKIWGVR